MMDLHSYKQSLSANTPPVNTSVYLQALWYEAKGNWDKAHELVQDLPDKEAAWVHAYLHHKEGDTWNADYWYSRAGRKRPAVSLDREWDQMAEALLQQ
ncbi:hypothetical protein CLV24_10666 [Pontibacter ummariensis]|uniref:Tetratricopeptide repeat-containing protein n=1 Tax=Pontibacter ummariensis TaxID=1610492 RepID=A0A239EBU8_9BACT|nr:hypothetical protein [Pontibacter ummariensis]PRY13152.1 hypothetical protein CLV24_10666 [Pontibacter ummariensis]SNS41372.1 hypothetical protein SAMN06296052_10666 [Pontibacter ummariensis]